MIRIGRICDMEGNVSTNKECENWMIVRAPDELLPYARLVKQLSPSEELFGTYRKAYEEGLFGRNFFDEVYVPWFLKDLSENEEAMSLLQKLYVEGKNRDFFLACYCENESLCHRSIIAGILMGMGAEIEADPTYKKYYAMFQKFNCV